MSEPSKEPVPEPDQPPKAPPRKVSKEELAERVAAHVKWLDSGKREGAQFTSGAREDLSGAVLPEANLSGADLRHANLSVANLQGANLSGAELRHADLSGADLRGAKLSGANLHMANLSGANLGNANLRGAILWNADLSGANLPGADLSGANLGMANLSKAHLHAANLHSAKLMRTRGLYGPDRATSLGTVNNAEHAVYSLKGADLWAKLVAHLPEWIIRLARRAVYWPNRALEWAQRIVCLPFGDFAHWALLRFIGTLHLFSASYFVFIAIVVYANCTHWLSEHVEAWRVWARAQADGPVKEFADPVARMLTLPVLWHFGLLLLAIGLLAFATTLHALFCPEAIKEATETRWTRELKEPLIEYRSAMYSGFWVRYITLVSFGLGGIYTLFYVLWRAWNALWFLLAS